MYTFIYANSFIVLSIITVFDLMLSAHLTRIHTVFLSALRIHSSTNETALLD